MCTIHLKKSPKNYCHMSFLIPKISEISNCDQKFLSCDRGCENLSKYK